ncbi:MAG: HAMP domain-containing histidine kinase [Clostridia bacterium]|nr:HAMP domain-containing histidine kinase [Clostridia bacterium]
MNEKNEIRKQLIKNMFLNFIIFTAILLVFDLIIYNEVAYSLYNSIDKELQNSVNRIGNMQQPEKINDRVERDFYKDFEKIEHKNQAINPRLIRIERNEAGEIQNKDALGPISNYSDEIKFNNSLNTVYNLQIQNEYNYRCINFEEEKDGEKIYVQVLANVDGEAVTLTNMKNTLIFGTITLVVVSMVVSYVLSKKAIKPMMVAYKKQTEFVQNASHELRTPLAIIQAKQELLLTEPNAKIIDKSEDINLTLKETRRLTKLISELMELARNDENNKSLEKQDTDLNKLIKEIATPYIDIAKMQEKEIKLDLNYNKNIKLNQSKINQLLVILLDNAVKYTNSGDTITIKTYDKDSKCNIEVQDTGIGISDESINHIFERFYRDDKARSRQTGGNGLGLSIAKTIVNLHGGTIKAFHNNPKGTIIRLRI